MDDTTAERASVERTDAHSQAALADRLITTGKLAGPFAHELNNLLTGILVFAEALARSTEAGREEAEQILGAARRCAERVRSLLEFARGGGEAPSVIAVAPLLARIAALVQHRALLGGLALELAAGDDLGEVRAARADLEHLLLALLLGALEAGQPGQRLRLGGRRTAGGVELALELAGEPDRRRGGGRPWLAPLPPSPAVCTALAQSVGGVLRGSVDAAGGLTLALPGASEAVR
jgi:signal transduction histidine kinase